MASEKRKAKMTKQEAIHILMHIETNVERDEDFGIMVKAPLMDACVLAIRALKADAVEVVHGRWSFIGENCCVCSVCHKHAIADYYFCPNCGAKMDGDGNA